VRKDKRRDLILIGVDPGLSTGLAMIKNEQRLAAAQGSPKEMLRIYRAALNAWCNLPDLTVQVAVERFIITDQTARHSQQSTALEVFGAIKTTAEHLGYPISVQAASDAKRIASNELLRCLGLWTSPRAVACPDANDVNDAMRHILLLLACQHATRFDELLARGCVDPMQRNTIVPTLIPRDAIR